MASDPEGVDGARIVIGRIVVEGVPPERAEGLREALRDALPEALGRIETTGLRPLRRPAVRVAALGGADGMDAVGLARAVSTAVRDALREGGA